MTDAEQREIARLRNALEELIVQADSVCKLKRMYNEREEAVAPLRNAIAIARAALQPGADKEQGQDDRGDDQTNEPPSCNVELAAALVRSLFCGLPNKERRMAVFVSFSDESETAGFFHHAGLIAWENEWDKLFVPAWQMYVLDRPPKIEYLHMTEIRSRAWREKRGLSREEAELRVNAAVNLICKMKAKWAFQICSTTRTEYIAEVGPLHWKHPKARRKMLRPDHLCWFGYMHTVLETVNRLYKGVHRVDFVIENKTGIFLDIRRLHDEFRLAFDEQAPYLSPLIGEVIPGGKDRIPLQAADVLCWYSQRAAAQTLEGEDIGRWAALAERPGEWHNWTRGEVVELSEAWKGK